MSKLSDRVAVIAGAGQGMGRATAELFVQEGAKVVGLDFNDALRGEFCEALPGGDFRLCDVSDPQAVQTVVDSIAETYGKIDVLINFAARVGGVGLRVHEVSVELWRATMGVNLDGAFLMMRAVIPHMLRTGGGSIVNFGSIAAFQVGPGMGPYASSKGGMLQLTRAAAIDYCRDNIRVNYVAPGMVKTPRQSAIPPALLSALADQIPMGRMGQAEEMAKLALFLASDDASFSTGGVFVADGGHMAGAMVG